MSKLKLFFVILVFGYPQYKSSVNAKRISELKCDEKSSLQTDSRSKNPFLMYISKTEPYITLGYGVLISEDYVLSFTCDFQEFKSNISYLKVRKQINPEELYDNSDSYGVKRVILHESHTVGQRNMFCFLLLQLNEAVSYHTNSSIFRPACLKYNLYDSIDTYPLLAYAENVTPPILPKLFPLVSNEEATRIITGSYINPMYYLHFNTSKFLPVPTMPVIQKIGNQNYLNGFVISIHSIKNSYMATVIKINHLIDWIEPIVWPIIQEPSLQCGKQKIKHKPDVMYMQPSYHGEFPWHIALYGENQKYICGGSIIGSLTILTAAHCVYNQRGVVLPANRFIVLAGTNTLIDYPIDAHFYIVKKVIVHENYNRHYLENDISILKLVWSIEFSNYIQPICIGNILDYSNITMGLVAGWGRDQQNQLSNLLLQTTLSIVDEFTCKENNRDFSSVYLNSRNYCAGYDNGTNVCSGDSGSAMIFEHNSQWYIRGIVSLGVAVNGIDKCNITKLVLFTDITKFYGWIINNLANEQ